MPRKRLWTPRDDVRRARDAARRKAARGAQKAAGTYVRASAKDHRLHNYARPFAALIGDPVDPDDFSNPRAECREPA